VNLDWHRLRAVVLESDDWGLCAWSADEQAFRVLSDTPAFRSPAGRRYGGSTLESAADVRGLAETLLEFRGADGYPPVWQANTVMASPDYVRLAPPGFEVDALPLLDFPKAPHRWSRPGLWGEVASATDAGVWWPEAHGLHHLPEQAWLTALRLGASDARRAFEQQCPVCEAVQASGEYDRSEPVSVRARNLAGAVERFRACFGRPPASFCPPDYRWDAWLEAEAPRHGLTVLQGAAERVGAMPPAVRRVIDDLRWPRRSGGLFRMPARVVFEPCDGERSPERVGVTAAVRRVREAWSRGRPAVLSTHRVNYAHLKPAWSESGRAALRDLLSALSEDGARFLTDVEVRDLQVRGWSARSIGRRGTLVRHPGGSRAPLSVEAPEGVLGVAVREGDDGTQVDFADGRAEVRAGPGETLLEWRRA
jgi:hypothetical protein